jgi:[CysO sulfur-carrier protein]-S-L-cysteine hydrolase
VRGAADDHRVRRLRRVLQRTLTIPSDVRRELERHARAELPNEACGLIVLSNGIAERYVAGRNRTASAYRFELEVDPETWFLEDEGYELAVFHSHVASPARPSRTDIENIGLWRGRPYLIFSLLDDELRAFTISGETVTPLELRDVEAV